MSTVPQPQTAKLQAVIENQDAIATLRAAVAQLGSTIQQKQADAQRLQDEADALAVPQSQREDLLADIATGMDRSAELAALDTRAEQHKSAIAAAHSEREAIALAVAGLTRRQERSQAELDALLDARPNLMRALLRARAETIGADYVQKTRELLALYRQLKGLSWVLGQVNDPATGAGRSLGGGGANDLSVPAFDLASVTPFGLLHQPALIAKGMQTQAESIAQGRIEEDRLRALGIDLA
ncbi:MAG: hypothetical protein E6Q67_14270 [Roseateles sp.]|nr:MAG: hypothetical protein E6Q67_14270 [Roseateles sp.]